MNNQTQVRRANHVGQAKMAAAILVAGAAPLLAACSSSGTSNANSSASAAATHSAMKSSAHPSHHSGSPKATASECKHVHSLRTSLESLTHTPLNATTAAKVRTDLTNIETQLTALKGKGSPAFSAEINRLSLAVTAVRKSAAAMSTPPTAAQVKTVVAALSALKTQSKTALTAMSKECPKS
jgi:hypothetical protein